MVWRSRLGVEDSVLVLPLQWGTTGAQWESEHTLTEPSVYYNSTSWLNTLTSAAPVPITETVRSHSYM